MIRVCIKWMALRLSGHLFPEENLITVNQIFTSHVNEANIQGVSGTEVLVALASFHKGFFISQHEAGTGMYLAEYEDDLSCSKVIHYLFRNYAKSSEISRAAADLRFVSREPMDAERELATMVKTARCQCGNVESFNQVSNHTLILFIANFVQ